MVTERRIETSISRAKAEKRRNAFLAPIPLEWVTKAASLKGKALQVAIAIRHQSALEKRPIVRLGNSLLRQMDVKGDAKRRGILALEREGLIRVARRNKGRSPVVEILEE